MALFSAAASISVFAPKTAARSTKGIGTDPIPPITVISSEAAAKKRADLAGLARPTPRAGPRQAGSLVVCAPQNLKPDRDQKFDCDQCRPAGNPIALKTVSF